MSAAAEPSTKNEAPRLKQIPMTNDRMTNLFVRHLVIGAWSLVILFALGGQLSAQEAWPSYSSGLPGPNDIARGPGSYFAIWKLVMIVVVVWLWVKSADWVGRDTDEMGDAIGMPGRIWNPI